MKKNWRYAKCNFKFSFFPFVHLRRCQNNNGNGQIICKNTLCYQDTWYPKPLQLFDIYI